MFLKFTLESVQIVKCFFICWQLDEDDKDDSVTTPDEDLVLKLVQKLQPKLVRSCSNTGNDQGWNTVGWNFKMKEWEVFIVPMGLTPDVFYSQQNLRFLLHLCKYFLPHPNLAFDWLYVSFFWSMTNQEAWLISSALCYLKIAFLLSSQYGENK